MDHKIAVATSLCTQFKTFFVFRDLLSITNGLYIFIDVINITSLNYLS